MKGGTQLQTFKSVGVRTHALNTELTLAHGSKVTVTVMATNAAELVSLAYSEAVTIDLTPPVIHYVNDGDNQTGMWKDIRRRSYMRLQLSATGPINRSQSKVIITLVIIKLKL